VLRSRRGARRPRGEYGWRSIAEGSLGPPDRLGEHRLWKAEQRNGQRDECHNGGDALHGQSRQVRWRAYGKATMIRRLNCAPGVLVRAIAGKRTVFAGSRMLPHAAGLFSRALVAGAGKALLRGRYAGSAVGTGPGGAERRHERRQKSQCRNYRKPSPLHLSFVLPYKKAPVTAGTPSAFGRRTANPCLRTAAFPLAVKRLSCRQHPG
jgi:hypothetical protein